MIKILFVCHANQSRSPLAEVIFKKMVNDAGVKDAFFIESRGVFSKEVGAKPHPQIIKRLKKIGIPWQDMKLQQIKQIDYRSFDFIICMDNIDEKYLKKHAGIYRDKVYLIRDINQETKKQSIPDPLETQDYDETFHLLNESLEEWLTMFKISKLSKAIDVEDYLISNKPLFLTNSSWYQWNPEIQKYEVMPLAPDEAILSHKEFYEQE